MSCLGNYSYQSQTLQELIKMARAINISQLGSNLLCWMCSLGLHDQCLDKKFSCFDRYSVKEYCEQILELCKNLNGKFIITSRKENKIMLNSEFKKKLITSSYVLCGKYPKVLITTNLNGIK